MKLNADIGESYGKWVLGDDANIMPLLDEANIACGFHAGDPLTIQSTITLAKQHNVKIGAHVSYPDIQGFGRRSMEMHNDELIAVIHAQIAVLEGLALTQGMQLSHVKPHGALYNDMMKSQDIFRTILMAMASYHKVYKLTIQALPNLALYQALAKQSKVTLKLEGFADRAYTNEGLLVKRTEVNAILNEQESLSQVSAMLKGDSFLSEHKQLLTLPINTLCVHGDTPSALSLCRKIRNLMNTIDSAEINKC